MTRSRMRALSDRQGANRRVMLLVVCGVLVTTGALCWILADFVIDRQPTIASGRANLHHLIRTWSVFAIAWIALTLLIRELGASPAESRQRFWLTGAFVLLTSAAFQTTIVFTHSPSLSDDIWRYVLDGRNTVSGVNPYSVSPDAIATDPTQSFDTVQLARRTNHPDLTTIYLPGSQLTFAGVSFLTEGLNPNAETAARWYRCVFVGASLWTSLVILCLLRSLQRSAWWVATFAWHPLMLVEVAGSGHQDILGIAVMLTGLWVYRMSKAGHMGLTIALWLASTIKPIVLPILFLATPRVRTGRYMAMVLGIGCLIWLPLLVFFELYPSCPAWDSLRHTMDEFLTRWEHHGSVFVLLRALGVSGMIARSICGGILILLLTALWESKVPLLRASRIFLFGAVLLSTTAHPWYLLWPLALFPLAPSAALWVASLTLPVGYIVLADVVDWSVPNITLLLTYAPIYLALVFSAYRRCRRERHCT